MQIQNLEASIVEQNEKIFLLKDENEELKTKIRIRTTKFGQNEVKSNKIATSMVMKAIKNYEDIPQNYTVTFDVKDLIENRKIRNYERQKTRRKIDKQIMTEQLKFENRKSVIVNHNILNVDTSKNVPQGRRKSKIDLYLNKGIELSSTILVNKETQTNVSSVRTDERLKNIENLFEEMQNSLEKEMSKLLPVKKFEHSSKNLNGVKILGLISEEIDLDEQEVKLDNLKEMLDYSKFLLHENDNLKNGFEEEKIKFEEEKESHFETLRVFGNFVVEICDEMLEIMKKSSKIDENLAFYNKNIEKCWGLFDSEMIINNITPEWKKIAVSAKANKIDEYMLTKLNNAKKKENFVVLFNEYLKSNIYGDEQILTPKLLKIIDKIIFEFFAKDIKDSNINDDNIDFKNPGENILKYFYQSYTLNIISKRKIFEFFNACKNQRKKHIRVNFFCLLFKLSFTKEDPILNLSLFETRQIIKFLKSASSNQIVIKNQNQTPLDDNLYFIVNRIEELIISDFQNIVSSIDSAETLQNLIIKNKQTVKWQNRQIEAVEFTQILIFFVDFIKKFFKINQNLIQTIFDSILLNENQGISEIDFLIINHYLFNKKLERNFVKNIFSKITEKNKILTHNEFENITMENELINTNYVKEFLKIGDSKKLTKVLENLREDLCSSSINNNVLHNINRRYVK